MLLFSVSQQNNNMEVFVFLSNVKMDRSSLSDTIFPTLEWIALTSNARMDDPEKSSRMRIF